MQLVTSETIKFFHNTFKEKFLFEDYTSEENPTVFFGVYRPRDLRRIANHKGLKIVWFAGYDASQKNTLIALKALDLNHLVVVAESKWIEDDLAQVGIEYVPISIFMDDLYKWKSVPLGDSLYWYNAGNSRYNKYLNDVKNAFPDLNIITNDSNTVPRDQMPEVYAKCFAMVRPVEHDGMSQSVAEMALMGRYSIWNGSGPFSVPFATSNDVVEAVARLRKADWNPDLLSRRSRGYFIRNEKEWTDLVLRQCGANELTSACIFNEDRGRCGSIFRIMRRSVIDQMPDGFGTDQFERPYISEQLTKMGLKELITSKNSGFIVSEWKALNNKGYAPGFKEFHTYDKKYS